MDYDLPPDLLDRDLVFEFFWRFSVFDCALKREGFLDQDRRGNARANWQSFAEKISGRLSSAEPPQVRRAVSEIVSRPPRRQVVKDGVLGWEEVEPQPGAAEEVYVVELLKVIRNNLFHGGKYPDGPIAEVERDKGLLRAALVILEEFYELHPGLKRWKTAA